MVAPVAAFSRLDRHQSRRPGTEKPIINVRNEADDIRPLEGHYALGVLVIALLLGGCDQIDNYILTVASKQKANEQLGAELKIAAAQNELKSLRSNLEFIKQEISGLKASQQFQQMLIDGVDKTPAEVTDSGGYGVAKTKQESFWLPFKSSTHIWTVIAQP